MSIFLLVVTFTPQEAHLSFEVSALFICLKSLLCMKQIRIFAILSGLDGLEKKPMMT